MLSMNEIIFICIFVYCIITLIFIFFIIAKSSSRHRENTKAINEISNSIKEISKTLSIISDKQAANEKVIADMKNLIDERVARDNKPVVVEIAEEAIVKKEAAHIKPQPKPTSPTVDLAARVADYANQIDQLGQIEDPQIRDLKKQVLIFELQEVKREIALIEG